MITRATFASTASSVLANRSWVSGRSGVRPWRRIAMALASHGPIQMGRYRSRPVSLRITTWRLESMWTRTLSTTISTSPSSIVRLSHGRRRRWPAPPGRHGDGDPCDHGASDESADVGVERHPTSRLDRPELDQPIDELEHEPEAEHDDRRDVDQLVEESEEHQ